MDKYFRVTEVFCASNDDVVRWSDTLIFITDSADSVNSFVMRSEASGNMFVSDNTTSTYKFLRVFTSHFMLLWKEAVAKSAG